MTIASLTSAASDIGGAVSDLFGASGASASASSYQEASAIATQNAEIAQATTNIQEMQTQRQIYQTIGAARAQIGGSGLAESGSALDILASSQSQGTLAEAMLREQGAITSNAYAEQAGLYAGMAKAASASAGGQTVAGLIQGAGGLVNLGSTVSGFFSGGSAAAAGAGIAGDLSAGVAATGAAADAAAAAGAAGGAAAAATTAIGGVGGTLAAAATTDAASAAGAGIMGTIGGVLTSVASVVGWVVCTELMRQGRLPKRWYAAGARRFAQYDERILRGYYIWAVPAVRHLRTRPFSPLSLALEWIFNHRAEFIAAQAGVRGARKTLRGMATMASVHALCWVLSRTIARRSTDWQCLYRTA